jgi:hypothetical protein
MANSNGNDQSNGQSNGNGYGSGHDGMVTVRNVHEITVTGR